MSSGQSRKRRENRSALKSGAAVARFIERLQEIEPAVNVAVDPPENASGETWIDISRDRFSTSISFRPGFGFGVYVTSDAYGEGPDEIFQSPEKTARRTVQLLQHTSTGSGPQPLTLAEIRSLAGFTQVQVADALSIRQPSVQRTEQRGNIRLETLASYVEAMGGRLETRLVFDDMEVRLHIPGRKGTS